MSTTATARTIYYLCPDTKEIKSSTLAEYLIEFRDMIEDPSQAEYIKENNEAVIAPAEERYDYSDGTFDEAKEEVIGTMYEVRKNPHSQHNGNKLREAFATEEEANQCIVDGLYWKWCNKSTNDPLHADTREEMESMIAEEAND